MDLMIGPMGVAFISGMTLGLYSRLVLVLITDRLILKNRLPPMDGKRAPDHEHFRAGTDPTLPQNMWQRPDQRIRELITFRKGEDGDHGRSERGRLRRRRGHRLPQRLLNGAPSAANETPPPAALLLRGGGEAKTPSREKKS